jgi:hypothetical protein
MTRWSQANRDEKEKGRKQSFRPFSYPLRDSEFSPHQKWNETNRTRYCETNHKQHDQYRENFPIGIGVNEAVPDKGRSILYSRGGKVMRNAGNMGKSSKERYTGAKE